MDPKVLTPAGGDSFYQWGDTFFDLTSVASSKLRMNIAEAIYQLLAAALLGDAPALIASGIASRRRRKVRFFDDEKKSVEGTLSRPNTEIVAGGSAGWNSINGGTQAGSQNSYKVPVAERVDERIFIREVDNFAQILETTWHEMTHIFTLKRHGDWSPSGGFKEPQSAENQDWVAFMQRLRMAAPVSVADPNDPKSEPWFIRNGVEWTCACGVSSKG